MFIIPVYFAIDEHATKVLLFESSINKKRIFCGWPNKMSDTEALRKDEIEAKVYDRCPGIPLPLDYSYFQIKTPIEILRIPPRIESPLSLKAPKNSDSKWLTRTLKLDNNALEDLNELPRVLSSLFPSDQWLTWLDISRNQLAKVHSELTELRALKILYLHGNRIASIHELLKLGALQNLTKLTAHGNPAELEPGYFITILAAIPKLVKLDFTAISINERKAADIFRASQQRVKLVEE